jgi:asparagine synthase (glutamine-hydrolysing)
MRLILGLINKKKKDTFPEFKKVFPTSIKDHKMLLLNENESNTINGTGDFDLNDLKGWMNVCILYPRDSHKKFFKIFNKESSLFDYLVVYGNMWKSKTLFNSKLPKDITTGNYIVVTKKGTSFTLSKDKIGIKQLYYGENPEFSVFSSRKTSLKLLNVDINKLAPGETIELNEKHIKKVTGNKLNRPKINIFQTEEALKKYKTALINSVKKRVNYKKSVGIILSGGIDSSIIAKITKDLKKNIICFCAAKSGSEDFIAAKEFSKQCDIPLKMIRLNEKMVEEKLPQIISTIETWNQYQVEEAVPMFFASQKAAENEMDIIMDGQGPDRLFAGYEYYPDILKKWGIKKLNDCLWKDLGLEYNEVFERENKIAESFNQELQLPYYDIEVIKTAMSISPNLKTKKDDVVRKYIHRITGENLGVPVFIAWRDKEYTFQSCGIHEMIKNITKKKGYVDNIEYKLKTDIEPNLFTKKYLNKYLTPEDRINDNSVQSYFEDIAIMLGIAQVKNN